ncbi:type II toxin-antitoxin system HicA family toxin [Methanolobus bombayensis]|uniref:type II toxin-antitoxin system HicA family toxin n=1 Tax=Methanolobus bombayensis TaxID=38023 RepID=UPI001FD83DDF|nr:type II toxin-antitoxin system HicA family toxin [Methanolobus bombayensis]MBP1910422.1 putative RNA binding protein YcfA (HicA-like mRNA interferase family) [Methanolobus bombayensis]
MSRLPLVDAKKMEKILFRLGFEKTRQKGSHAFYKHIDGRTTTIPFHSSKKLARPLIRVILNEINISIEEYNELIRNL